MIKDQHYSILSNEDKKDRTFYKYSTNTIILFEWFVTFENSNASKLKDENKHETVDNTRQTWGRQEQTKKGQIIKFISLVL